MFSLVFFGAVQKGEASSPALFLKKYFDEIWSSGIWVFIIGHLVCLKKITQQLDEKHGEFGRNGSGDDVKKPWVVNFKAE